MANTKLNKMEILDLIKRKTSNKVAEVKKTVELKTKTTEELIEEIHENFFTEVDRLLAEAKISRSLDTDKQDLIDKCERLKNLGFTNTKEVKEAEKEIERLRKLKQENEEKKTLIEAIEYFSTRYPQYKFITEESVLKICQKYNLVYGEISRYTGDVPEKNLKHIEQFNVDVKDECFIYERKFISFGQRERTMEKRYITDKKYNEINKRREESMHFDMYSHGINMKCPLEIAAPVKDFNMEGMEVKNYKLSKIEIPDPVVLKPVIFRGQKHYLIVTAWGEEANDEIVVNQNFN
jgi:hypothetical protein